MVANVIYPQITTGISRNLWRGDFGDLVPNDAAPSERGGGELNGSANQAHLMGQAGTGMGRINLPRAIKFGGNYCGVV